jgi:hypothetical protein
MVVVAIFFAVVAFGFAVAMLVIANRQRDKPGVAAAGRLAALRYALVGVGLLAGLYWFGFVIVALALWVLLLPVGYGLARRG